MALLTVDDKTDQAKQFAGEKFDPDRVVSYGKEAPVHTKVVTYTNSTGAALAANSIVEFIQMNHCLILPSSRVANTAMGAGRTLDLGLQEYTGLDGATVASDIDALADGLDVSAALPEGAALRDNANSLTLPGGLEVNGQAAVLGQILGGTLPNGESITLILEFIPYRG